MKPFILKSSEFTPEVILDPTNNVFSIKGVSILENAHAFYQPIIEWVEQYTKTPNAACDFHFNYEYLNTLSSKMVVDILHRLETIKINKGKVSAYWHYEEEDEHMENMGKLLEAASDLPFFFKAY